MKRIKLVIGGIDYYINSDEDETYLHGISDELTGRIETIKKQAPFLSTTMVALFAAFEFLDESKKLQKEVADFKQQIKGYVEESAVARLEADEARREIERLGNENYNLRQTRESSTGTIGFSPVANAAKPAEPVQSTTPAKAGSDNESAPSKPWNNPAATGNRFPNSSAEFDGEQAVLPSETIPVNLPVETKSSDDGKALGGTNITFLGSRK